MERLSQGLQLGHKLILVSAPAGFGKTTLVNVWSQTLGEATPPTAVAWISLDEGDNDLVRFLAYFITALNQLEGTPSIFGKSAMAMLQAPQPPSIEGALTPLINELANISDPIVLVLDDYHLIGAQPVHDTLGFLLDNSPPSLHIVVTTREDPPLPLARLRALTQLTELRAADLRFNSAEAADFLNCAMGLDLSAEHITALERRTEGWITGLQLAAISMQGRRDSAGFIQSFTGSHRFVMDYLIEEVLDQQPDEVQTFLLQTAILNRLTGPLCDTLTKQTNGQETLERLDHANLFIIPLDDERRWYRYHGLFADLLRQSLQRTHAELVPKLHLRASEWYEQNAQLPDAIYHALEAKDFERVADLAQLAWRPMNMKYQAVTWLRWVKAIPEALVRSRPLLSAGCGWASLDAGNFEAAEMHLRDAERWLETTEKVKAQIGAPAGKTYPEGSRKTAVLNVEETRALSALLANGRAYLAQALGDVAGTLKYARRATDFLRENDYFERGLAEILSGFAYWASGNLEAARKEVTNAISSMQMGGKFIFVISYTSYLVDIMVAQGRLREARKTYLHLLETAIGKDEPEISETAVLHLGLSELFLEQGDTKAAKWHLQRSEALGEQYSFAPWYRHWIYAHVRVLSAQGDFDRVIAMLNGADRLYYRHPIPDIRPLKSLKARAWLAQDNLREALNYAPEQSPAVNDELSYLGEYEHITQARVLLARDRRDHDSIDAAHRLLARLLKAAEESERIGSVIELLVLQASAFEAQGNMPLALEALQRALTLAEPEAYVRVFVDEGRPMARLLDAALQRGIAPDYVRRLLAAFPADEVTAAEQPTFQADQSQLVEPLSEREIEVLHKIAEGCTNREIAERLYLSLNTVKAHTRNIYGKLGVHNRTTAVARARALGILPAA